MITVFKVMSIDEVTKGWSPGQFKQEVSKMERTQQSKLIKGKKKKKPAENVKGSQQNVLSRKSMNSFQKEGNCAKCYRQAK